MLFLPTDGCGWAVTAENGCFVGQAKELVLDAVHFILKVAARQVCSPDASLKKRVAAQKKLSVWNIV